jgi:hypothetical protein
MFLAWASETESAFGSTFMPSAKSVQLIATHANSGVIYLVNFFIFRILDLVRK